MIMTPPAQGSGDRTRVPRGGSLLNQIEPSVTKDWATNAAIDLIADFHRMPYNDAVEVTASLLRTLSAPPRERPSDLPTVSSAPAVTDQASVPPGL